MYTGTVTLLDQHAIEHTPVILNSEALAGPQIDASGALHLLLAPPSQESMSPRIA